MQIDLKQAKIENPDTNMMNSGTRPKDCEKKYQILESHKHFKDFPNIVEKICINLIS